MLRVYCDYIHVYDVGRRYACLTTHCSASHHPYPPHYTTPSPAALCCPPRLRLYRCHDTLATFLTALGGRRYTGHRYLRIPVQTSLPTGRHLTTYHILTFLRVVCCLAIAFRLEVLFCSRPTILLHTFSYIYPLLPLYATPVDYHCIYLHYLITPAGYGATTRLQPPHCLTACGLCSVLPHGATFKPTHRPHYLDSATRLTGYGRTVPLPVRRLHTLPTFRTLIDPRW